MAFHLNLLFSFHFVKESFRVTKFTNDYKHCKDSYYKYFSCGFKVWVFIIKLYTLLNAKIKNRNNSDESSLAIYHIHRDKEEEKIEKAVKRVILLYVPDADLICSI